MEGDLGARCQCSIASCPCHPPPLAPICLMRGKQPIPWGRGRHFHPLEMAGPWIIGKVKWDQCWWFQFHCLRAHKRRWRRWSWVSLGHLDGRLEWYPAATKRLWTVWAETLHPVRQIISTLIFDDERNLFLLMGWIWAWFSVGVVILKRCPCDLWIALLVSRTRRRTLAMPRCDTPVFFDITLWESPRPENQTMSSRISGGILASIIAALFWNCNLCSDST